MAVHPTAIVHASAALGRDVTIGPYAVVGPESRIGDGCELRAHAVLEYATLGPRCVVYPFAAIGLEPQHGKYKGEKTRVEIGADGVFREGVTIHRGTMLDKGVTRVGDRAFFMAYSHVAHDCVVGNGVTMANNVLLAGHVHVGDNVFISGLAAVHQFVRVGAGAIVSGGAMAVLDVAPYCIAQGDRAVLRGLNVIGLRRQGAGRDDLRQLKAAYQTVFLSKASLAEALASEALAAPSPYVRTFREFLSEPKRGFVRPASRAAAETEPSEAMA